jgi:sec-independent protein translocase protein TatB
VFDVGFPELVLVFIIGLLVLGPQRLPKVAAEIGKWVGRARRTATELRRQLEREIELSDIKPPPPPPPTQAETGAPPDAAEGASPPTDTAAEGIPESAGAPEATPSTEQPEAPPAAADADAPPSGTTERPPQS